MKKTVDLILFRIFWLFLVILSPLAFCQAQISIGLSGGGGFTQSTGFRAAIPVEIDLRKSLYLFGGPAFIQRRNQEVVRKLSFMRDYLSAEMDYFSFPVLIKARLEWQPIRIYGMVGLELNYGLRIQATGLEDQRLFKERLDFEQIEISRFDGGFLVGGGFEADLRGRRKIFADLRYYQGLTDIDPSPLGEIYNEGLYVTLGFIMPLFKRKLNQSKKDFKTLRH